MTGDADDKCQICAKAKPDCTCNPTPQSNASKVIQTAIKPPDLFIHKEDLPAYARKLRRWSRACGIELKLQGDFILLHQSSTNPNLHERLDRELGDKLLNDKTPVETIITTLEQWFGVDKGVNLMKIFNDFVAKSRKPDQDLHQYTADFEDSYNKLQKMGEKLSSRLLALFLLKNANLTDTEFQIVTANLDFSSESKADSLYEDTKGSLNKHQNCRVINSKPTGAESTFLIDSRSLDSLSEEQQNELVLWLKRKQKPEGNSDDPPPKRWRKCHHCICKCFPKWKKCNCPCSQHPPWKCPQKKKEEGGENLKPDETHFCSSLGNAKKTFIVKNKTADNTCNSQQENQNVSNLKRFRFRPFQHEFLHFVQTGRYGSSKECPGQCQLELRL